MENLTMLYLNEILEGRITNINQVSKLVRKKVKARLADYGLGVDEEGNIYVLDQKGGNYHVRIY